MKVEVCLMFVIGYVYSAPIDDNIYLKELDDALLRDISVFGENFKYGFDSDERNNEEKPRNTFADKSWNHSDKMNKVKTSEPIQGMLPTSRVCCWSFPSLPMIKSLPTYKFPTLAPLKPFPTWAPLKMSALPPWTPFPVLTPPTVPAWTPIPIMNPLNLLPFMPITAPKPALLNFTSNEVDSRGKFQSYPMKLWPTFPVFKFPTLAPFKFPIVAPLNFTFRPVEQYNYNWTVSAYNEMKPLPLSCDLRRPTLRLPTSNPCPFSNYHSERFNLYPNNRKPLVYETDVRQRKDKFNKWDPELIGELSEAVNINITSVGINGNNTVHLKIPNGQHYATQIFNAGNNKTVNNFTIVIMNTCRETDSKIKCADKNAFNFIPSKQGNFGDISVSKNDDKDIMQLLSLLLEEVSELDEDKLPISLAEYDQLKDHVYNENEENQREVLKDIKSLLFGESMFVPSDLTMARAQPGTDASQPEVNGSNDLATTLPVFQSSDSDSWSEVTIPESMGVEDDQSADSSSMDSSESMENTVSVD